MKKLILASLISSLLVGCGGGSGSTDSSVSTGSLTIEQQQELEQAIKDGDELIAQANKQIEEGNALLESYKPEPNTDHLITAEEIPDGDYNIVVTQVPFNSVHMTDLVQAKQIDVCGTDEMTTQDESYGIGTVTVTGYFKNDSFVEHSCHGEPSRVEDYQNYSSVENIKSYRDNGIPLYISDDIPTKVTTRVQDDGATFVTNEWFNDVDSANTMAHFRDNDLPSIESYLIKPDGTKLLVAQQWITGNCDTGTCHDILARNNGKMADYSLQFYAGMVQVDQFWAVDNYKLKQIHITDYSPDQATIRNVYYTRDQQLLTAVGDTTNLMISCVVADKDYDSMCPGEAESDAIHVLPHYIK